MNRWTAAVVLALTLGTPGAAAAQRRVDMDNQDRYDDTFRKYSKRFFGVGFDWHYFKAQGLAESGLDPAAKSPVGARGVMQLMPGTSAWLESDVFGRQHGISGPNQRRGLASRATRKTLDPTGIAERPGVEIESLRGRFDDGELLIVCDEEVTQPLPPGSAGRVVVDDGHDGEIVVLDLRASRYLTVNGSGAFLWPRIVEGVARDQLVSDLSERYSVSIEQAGRDVDSFVNGLADRGLLE